MELLYKDEAFQIIGAAQEVHRQLGHGFLEAVYQEALAVEFTLRTIPFEKEKSFPVFYKNQTLDKYYQADFYCYGKIIVELKALVQITSDHEAQVLNYLKITKSKLGILINFGQKSLVFRRLLW
ncbi:GxxExxY protein [Prosthecochloris marina]|uniref:GxxExxY protein n=1 Tax=Prosthecochloris marina TaxID=2017681 RepID=A0A317T3E0_9CHLB|nr:GxxExxY protein [Prosthecochloris marina]PWW81212.1 GxxExxY protein [Prosthecochloris marina]